MKDLFKLLYFFIYLIKFIQLILLAILLKRSQLNTLFLASESLLLHKIHEFFINTAALMYILKILRYISLFFLVIGGKLLALTVFSMIFILIFDDLIKFLLIISFSSQVILSANFQRFMIIIGHEILLGRDICELSHL